MKIRILQSISGTNGAFAAGKDFVHAPLEVNEGGDALGGHSGGRGGEGVGPGGAEAVGDEGQVDYSSPSGAERRM